MIIAPDGRRVDSDATPVGNLERRIRVHLNFGAKPREALDRAAKWAPVDNKKNLMCAECGSVYGPKAHAFHLRRRHGFR